MTSPVNTVIHIQDELRRGLRRDDRDILNQFALSECLNARPTERGLESAPLISEPFNPYDYKTGSEILTNGNFTADASGWTVGADWTWGFSRMGISPSTDPNVTILDRALIQPTVGTTAGTYYVIQVQLEGADPEDVVFEGGNLVCWLDLTPAYPVYQRQQVIGSWVVSFVIKSPVATPQLMIQVGNQVAATVNVISMYECKFGPWPHPQLFRGRESSILMFDDEIHLVDETATPTWDSEALVVEDGAYYPTNLIVNGTFQNELYWNLADAGLSIALSQLNIVPNADTSRQAIYTDPGAAPVAGQDYTLEVECEILAGSLLAYFGGDFVTLTSGRNKYLLEATDTSTFYFWANNLTNATIKEVKLFNSTSHPALITAGGGPWSFVDSHGFWVVCNNDNILIRNVESDQKVYKMPDTVATCCCSYKGRMLFAGFDGGNDYGLWGTLPTNSVWWSSIGGGNVVELFRKNLRLSSVMDDLTKRGDSGYAVMPWRGNILQMAPLGTGVVVFGEEGVAALIQYTEPIPTFGTQPIKTQVGLSSRAAVGIAPDRLIYIDRSGSLWIIDQEFKATRLGYEEYFQPIVHQYIVISYDPHMDEFWIGTPERCFVFNSHGLGEVNRIPTTINYVDGGLVGVQYYQKTFSVFNPGEHLDDFSIALSTFDMQNREVKTIHSVEFGLTDPTKVETRILYRYDKAAAFESTEWKTLDRNGYAVMIVSGVEFQLQMRTEEYSDTLLDYININWRQNKKKSIRDLILAN